LGRDDCSKECEQIEQECGSEEVPDAPEAEIKTEKSAAGEGCVDIGRIWRLAMRAASCAELPGRRSGGQMRDGSIARWENAAWRLWSQELHSSNGLPTSKSLAQPNAVLDSKVTALSALPCLLCGVDKQCDCLGTTNKNSQGDGGSTTPLNPSQALLDECFHTGALADSDQDDPEPSASRVAARWRLYNTAGADLPKPSKRVEYQLWRSLQPCTPFPVGNSGFSYEQPRWACTPDGSECGQDSEPLELEEEPGYPFPPLQSGAPAPARLWNVAGYPLALPTPGAFTPGAFTPLNPLLSAQQPQGECVRCTQLQGRLSALELRELQGTEARNRCMFLESRVEKLERQVLELIQQKYIN